MKSINRFLLIVYNLDTGNVHSCTQLNVRASTEDTEQPDTDDKEPMCDGFEEPMKEIDFSEKET